MPKTSDTPMEFMIILQKATHKMGVKNISVFDDSELVVQQIKRHYQRKHPRRRSYQNYAQDIIENYFDAFNITIIPWEYNIEENSLGTACSTFKPPYTQNQT